jgi:anti-sigma regulatory factor (Ser/Thr protein kinase)
MPETVCRTFGNDPAELRSMSEWFRHVAERAGVEPDVAGRAEVCLNEAATNVILYAFDDGARHPITIDLQAAPTVVQITIADDGRPFNPLDAASPPAPTSLEEAPIGGLGIQLIRAYARNIEYRRVAGRNELVLTVIATC